MSDLRLFPAGEDGEVTRELRAIYAAPASEAYWTELEGRIMNRVLELQLDWRAELAHWARPALAAAAVALLAAGIALFRHHRAEAELAYDNILSPTPIPVETAVRPIPQGKREATLRYLIAH